MRNQAAVSGTRNACLALWTALASVDERKCASANGTCDFLRPGDRYRTPYDSDRNSDYNAYDNESDHTASSSVLSGTNSTTSAIPHFR